jgi:hypothetical protein
MEHSRIGSCFFSGFGFGALVALGVRVALRLSIIARLAAFFAQAWQQNFAREFVGVKLVPHSAQSISGRGGRVWRFRRVHSRL